MHFMCYFIIKLCLIICSDAFVWFVSEDGDSVCSNYSDACQSLYDVIKLSSSDDVIMLPSDEEIEFCGEEKKLSKSLTFRGAGESQSELKAKGNCSLLFSLQDGKVTFININFIHGYISAVDSHIDFESCTFNEFVFYGMNDKFVEYYHLQNKRKRVWDTIFGMSLACNFVQISFLFCQWDFVDDPDSILADMPRRNGIQIICKTAGVNISDSFMADKEINTRLNGGLKLNMENSVFDGRGSMSFYPGGLKIDAGKNPSLLIQNCSFSAMRYSDLGIIASYKRDGYVKSIGAISLIANGLSSNVFPHFKHFTIANCSFEGNQRALDIKGRNIIRIHIENSVFSGNEVLDEGAAIRVLDFGEVTGLRISTYSYILIRTSMFHSNKAGVNPFNMTVVNMYKEINFEQKSNITDFKIGTKKMYVSILETITSSHLGIYKLNRVVTFHLMGKGGAILSKTSDPGYIEILIENSTFVDNVATGYGGSMYGNHNARFKVKDSIIQGSSRPHTVSQGDLIFSTGSFQVDNSNLRGYFGTTTGSMIYFQHPMEVDLFKIISMDFTCPTGNKLEIENITTHVEKTIEEITDQQQNPQILKFSTFKLSCVPCDNKEYTYDKSHVIIKQINQSEVQSMGGSNNIFSATLKTHEIVLHQPECYVCPYGGYCQESKVGAKANYWGWKQDGQVTFHPCPSDYCCEDTDGCEEYDACASNRYGTLCGRCKPGFSEAMFSVKCVPNAECNDKWVIYFTVFLAVVYSLFLLFQDDLKNFLYSAPIGKATMLENLKYRKSTVTAIQAFKSNIRSRNRSEMVLGTRETKPKDSTNSSDEGGIFLILLFYYFQDASIIHFKTVFVDADPPSLVLIRDIIGGLFNFRIDVMQFAENACIHSDLTPVSKSLIKLLFVPTVSIILLLIFAIGKTFQHMLPRKLSNLSAKASGAIILACLFSFQRLSQTFFSFVSCSVVMDSHVLFIDGTITCYNRHQWLAMLYIMVCIVPFGFYIAIIPSFLNSGEVSFESFFLGCLIPLPWLVVFFSKRLLFGRRNHAISSRNPCCDQVYKILQGPYRDYRVKHFPYPICWSGALLIRRLWLILAHSFIDDVTKRLSLMFVVCFIAFVHHNMARPCKESRANMAGAISNSALLLVCAINWIRATYESNGTVPKGPNADLIDIFNFVEQVLLLWIPLVAALLLVLFLLFRVTMKITHCLTERCQKPQPEAKEDQRIHVQEKLST